MHPFAFRIPLSQSKLDYTIMDMEFRQMLPLQLSKHSAEFGLENIKIPSFLREYDYSGKISACDTVYALLAQLEYPCMADSIELRWAGNFFRAYDSLWYMLNYFIISSGYTKLKHGISLSITQHPIIHNECMNILSHRLIRIGKSIRYVLIRNYTENAWFSNITTLRRIGLYLLHATKVFFCLFHV